MEGLFRDFWWLIFPIFGMVMAVWGMVSSERQSRSAIDAIKAYTDQGKEPPPELMKIVLARDDSLAEAAGPRSPNSRAWTFVVFAALTAGFGVGFYWVRDQDYAFAFLIVAVTMGVMALGALGILIFGRKS